MRKPSQPFAFRPIDLRAASDAEYAQLNAFKNILRGEVLPEDPPKPLAYDTERFKATPAMVQNASWGLWDQAGAALLAFCRTDIFNTGDNPHMIDFMIEVLPGQRRQGIATAMLRLAAEQARSQGRRVLTTECNDRVPAGGGFMSRLGGRMGLAITLTQLRIADIDQALVDRWLEREAELSADFSLGFWDGRYPEDAVEGVATLEREAGRDEPRDTLDMEPVNYTPETIRQMEAIRLSAGNQRWTIYVSERSSGVLAGLTEVFWNPNNPTIVQQSFTGVLPDYRNRGLGRWLKAAMLKKILRDRPQAVFIRTGNANSNAPMLKLNNALGFTRHMAEAVWQVELESVEQYLASRL